MPRGRRGGLRPEGWRRRSTNECSVTMGSGTSLATDGADVTTDGGDAAIVENENGFEIDVDATTNTIATPRPDQLAPRPPVEAFHRSAA